MEVEGNDVKSSFIAFSGTAGLESTLSSYSKPYSSHWHQDRLGHSIENVANTMLIQRRLR